MMEEATANVRVEVSELQHRDVSPNEMISQEIVNVTATTDEVIENPEYVMVLRSATVQAVAREEIVIPRQGSTRAKSSDATVSSSGSNTMEMDISSQESAMDIASQESLPIKKSKSKKPKSCKRSSSTAFLDELNMMSDKEVIQNIKNLFSCEDPRKKKEYLRREQLEDKKRTKLINECRRRLKLIEEVLDEQQQTIATLHSELVDCIDYFARGINFKEEEEQESEEEEDIPPYPEAKEIDCLPCLKRARKG